MLLEAVVPEDIEDVRELDKEERAQIREDVELRAAFVELERFEPWKLYKRKLEALAGDRGSDILQPLADLVGALRQEYAKGTMSGLLLAATLPGVTIQVTGPTSDDEED